MTLGLALPAPRNVYVNVIHSLQLPLLLDPVMQFGFWSRYKLGVDFELLPPRTAPSHYDPKFLELFAAGDEATSVRRLPTGTIPAESDVLVSYDFGTTPLT